MMLWLWGVRSSQILYLIKSGNTTIENYSIKSKSSAKFSLKAALIDCFFGRFSAIWGQLNKL